MKKTISLNQFIAEFGSSFSEHMKERLMELNERCVLTRKEFNNRLDIKHTEHTKYEGTSGENGPKEYSYGQFIMIEDSFYFGEKSNSDDVVMESPVVNQIYTSLRRDGEFCENDVCARKINDDNIDYVVDSILNSCPPVSQAHLDIVKKMMSLSRK